MKRSKRAAICAVAGFAAVGLSSAPALADPPPPDANGYTHAIPSTDIRCIGLSPNIFALPATAGFAIFDLGDGKIDAMLSLPAPLTGEYFSHVDFSWRNSDTGQSGSQHIDSRRFFGAGPENFKATTGRGKIEVSANISNSLNSQSISWPMTPCRSFATIS